MGMPVEVYRDQIIRAVTGNQPAMVFHVTDETALRRLSEGLAESERAHALIRAKGYGNTRMLLDELAALVPNAR
jgi:pyrroline-5-carboxylate reductase